MRYEDELTTLGFELVRGGWIKTSVGIGLIWCWVWRLRR